MACAQTGADSQGSPATPAIQVPAQARHRLLDIALKSRQIGESARRKTAVSVQFPVEQSQPLRVSGSIIQTPRTLI